MSFTPSSFGFELSNREIATLFYLSLLLGAVVVWEKTRRHVFGVVRAFLAPQLIQVWLLMSLYVAALCLASRLAEFLGMAQSQIDLALVANCRIYVHP